jgi:cell division septation protein DedD
MPTTDCAITGIAPPDLSPGLSNDDLQMEAPPRASDAASKSLRGLFFGFTATVTVGLALASWYVGVRIVAADEVARPSTITQTPPPVPTVTAQPAAAPSVAAPPTSLYLQVAGLGPKRDAAFVNSLQAKGFQAQIPTLQVTDDGNPRILIGPYATHTEMEQAQRNLQSAGVLAVETAH